MRSKGNVADNVPKQVQPFCFVKILAKDADSTREIQEAVRLFEENDQLHFQISEKIRDKVFEREKMLSRLKDLKIYYLPRHNQSTSWKLDILNILHQALDNLSVANKPHKGRAMRSCITEEELNNKNLSYMMLHGCKNLTEEKQLLRNKNTCCKTDDASSAPLSELLNTVKMKYSSYNYNNNRNICDKLLKEIRVFEVTRKKSAQLKESLRNQVKIVSDELMEMWKKKQALETEIKHVDKQIEGVNEEIWSFQNHLKDRNCRKDASLFMLKKMTDKEYWVLKYCNLEYESFHCHTIFLDKSSSQEISGSLHITAGLVNQLFSLQS